MEEILKKLNYQREFLTEDDILNLMSLSAHFFVNYPVNEARQRLRELYQSWIYQSYECADSEKIKDMLLFYTQLISFINACYVFTGKIDVAD